MQGTRGGAGLRGRWQGCVVRTRKMHGLKTCIYMLNDGVSEDRS